MNKCMAVCVLTLAGALVGCAEPPNQAVDDAKRAISDASEKAERYAADALREAEDAQAKLEAELKAQEDKFALFRSYDKAEQLAAEAKAAGERASQAAQEGEVRARQEATDKINQLKTAIDEVTMLLDQAPTGKGTAADIAALRGDVDSIRASLGDIEQSLDSGDYQMASTRADAARQSVEDVRTEINTAIEAAQASRKR